MAIRLKIFWCSRGESISKEINGVKIERDIKLGMTVESDSADTSTELHNAASKALNAAFEREREAWMNDKAMTLEIERLKVLEPKNESESSDKDAKEHPESESKPQIKRSSHNG